MKVSDAARKNNIFYSYCILFLMLIFSFAMLMGVDLFRQSRAKVKVAGTLGMLEKYGLTALMSIITNVINYVLSVSI